MSPRPQQAVTLGELLAQPMKVDLNHLCVASDARAVRGVVLVSDIDEITSIEPDTIIVLSADVARGSWMVSAALRYAWERNACALIVPDRALNPSVTQLAERFQISLFTTAAEITLAAIEVATAVGMARAQLVSSLHRLTSRVGSSEDITEVLEFASVWLQGAPVELESSGAVVRSAMGTTNRPDVPNNIHTLPSRVSVRVGRGTKSQGLLVANVPASLRDHAASVLEICASKLRTLIAEEQFHALQQSLPPISIAALAESNARLPQHPGDPGWPAWPSGTSFVTLCLLSDHADRYGAALHHLWLAAFRDWPLVRAADGWLAFVPVDDTDLGVLVAKVHGRLAEIHLLNLQVGVSLEHYGDAELRPAIREAWLAARVAEAGKPHAIVSYDEIPARFLPRLLPPSFAEETLHSLYPALASDEHRDELIHLYTCYAAHLGSATDTAAHLGIHRNTVKLRLERLADLGVPVSDPTETLGIHMLFAALPGGTTGKSPGGRLAPPA